MAEEAKAGKFGVDAQADELLAQIALAEQGGALSLYESALDAVRKGDVATARGPADRGRRRPATALDDGLRQKVQDLLDKLPKDDAAGKATVDRPARPGRRLRRPRRPEAQRRGRHQDRRGPPAPGDRPRQGDRHLRADPQGRQGLGPARRRSPGR